MAEILDVGFLILDGFFPRRREDAKGVVRECESPRVSGQPTPRDAVDRMGGGRFEGANVKVNEGGEPGD